MPKNVGKSDLEVEIVEETMAGWAGNGPLQLGPDGWRAPGGGSAGRRRGSWPAVGALGTGGFVSWLWHPVALSVVGVAAAVSVAVLLWLLVLIMIFGGEARREVPFRLIRAVTNREEPPAPGLGLIPAQAPAPGQVTPGPGPAAFETAISCVPRQRRARRTVAAPRPRRGSGHRYG
jgi:hypothetical protein